MGVCYEVVCRQCKQFIDIHKAYAFDTMCHRVTPPCGSADRRDEGDTNATGDYFLRGGYWESRGLWFLWKHRGHQGIEMQSDHSSDEWWEERAKFEEVFPYHAEPGRT
jgi:hypothetical protein